MEVDNTKGLLQFGKIYKSNSRVYEETHGGVTVYSFYYYLIMFNQDGLFTLVQVFNGKSITDSVESFNQLDRLPSNFFQLDNRIITFEINEYGESRIFSGQVLKDGIVGKYSDSGQFKSKEVFELLEK